jgi:hypothetical protein
VALKTGKLDLVRFMVGQAQEPDIVLSLDILTDDPKKPERPIAISVDILPLLKVISILIDAPYVNGATKETISKLGLYLMSILPKKTEPEKSNPVLHELEFTPGNSSALIGPSPAN